MQCGNYTESVLVHDVPIYGTAAQDFCERRGRAQGDEV